MTPNCCPSVAGTSGVDALVAVMTAKEDGNFRLFSYVGDINSEAEKLQGHADDVQKELDRYQAAADAQDSERQTKLQVSHRLPPLSHLCGDPIFACQGAGIMSRQNTHVSTAKSRR